MENKQSRNVPGGGKEDRGGGGQSSDEEGWKMRREKEMTDRIVERRQGKYYMERMNNRVTVQQLLTSIISKRVDGSDGSWSK